MLMYVQVVEFSFDSDRQMKGKHIKPRGKAPLKSLSEFPDKCPSCHTPTPFANGWCWSCNRRGKPGLKHTTLHSSTPQLSRQYGVFKPTSARATSRAGAMCGSVIVFPVELLSGSVDDVCTEAMR